MARDPEPTPLRARLARRAAVEAFVIRHFSLPGTLRLHRAALGWDLLRAPLNVALAPVFLLTRLIAFLLSLVGLRRAGRWLATRRVLLRTSVARAVEARIADELLAEIPVSEADRTRLLGDYTAVRSAVSEITTSLIVLVIGFTVFRIVTPGVVSLAPVISGYVLHSNAVAGFPLGARLGSLWYGVFPVELPVWYVLAVGFGLALAASVITTFAGVVADPIQKAFGIHRRRLLRLLAAMERAGEPGLASEHILARFADITDASVSLMRFFRP